MMAGVRSLEIDIFPDPVGGTYDQSVALRVAGVDGWINNTALADPGFKVSLGKKFLCTISAWNSAVTESAGNSVLVQSMLLSICSAIAFMLCFHSYAQFLFVCARSVHMSSSYGTIHLLQNLDLYGRCESS